MAVQKSRRTRSTRGMRRSHDALVSNTASLSEESNDALSPAVRRLLGEHDIAPSDVKGTGVGGRITREDVDAHIAASGFGI